MLTKPSEKPSIQQSNPVMWNNHHRRKTFQVWSGMKQRCYNPKCAQYKNYGARGIWVCKRWMGDDGFENFLSDMGIKPDGLSLDRKNNDRGYYPSNCRWATPSQQRRNCRQSVHLITVGGVTMSAQQWSLAMGFCKCTVGTRIRKGWNPIKAVTTPALIRHRSHKPKPRMDLTAMQKGTTK